MTVAILNTPPIPPETSHYSIISPQNPTKKFMPMDEGAEGGISVDNGKISQKKKKGKKDMQITLKLVVK